ncbi:MAG TPA: hypothetical protein VGM90_00135 [Kofleriaceae bacterium]|jgi:hypothetical protein
MRSNLLMFLTVAATGCTTLGPMPMSTGVSAVPVGRPSMEVSAGAMPGFYLSDAAQEHLDQPTHGSPISDTHLMLEPDRLLGTKGLVVGARSFGDNDKVVEPMVGYRRKLDQNFSVLGIGYGGKGSGGDKDGTGAYYEATRLGGELTVDFMVGEPILSFHLFGSISSTYVNAHGRYCVGGDGWGRDCEDDSRRVNAEINGVYTAANAGVSIDIARRPEGYLHDIRLLAMGSFGVMPRVYDGEQEPSKQNFESFGFALQFAVGAEK